MRARLLLLLFPCISAVTAPAPAAAAVEETCAPFDHSHAAWTAFLGEFVADGRVDYRRLHADAEARARLEGYLAALGAACPDAYATWSEPEQIAYWINLYNAATVALVVAEYPIASIRVIGWLPHAAFRRDFIRSRLVDNGDAEFSLDHIEHRILRKRYREPRIHFALVCAAVGCPDLSGEAWRGDTLDTRLDTATRRYLAAAKGSRYDEQTHTLHLSAIFKWFADDFERSDGSVSAFVVRHLSSDAASRVTEPELTVRFLDYDWSLNERHRP